MIPKLLLRVPGKACYCNFRIYLYLYLYLCIRMTVALKLLLLTLWHKNFCNGNHFCNHCSCFHSRRSFHSHHSCYRIRQYIRKIQTNYTLIIHLRFTYLFFILWGTITVYANGFQMVRKRITTKRLKKTFLCDDKRLKLKARTRYTKNIANRQDRQTGRGG